MTRVIENEEQYNKSLAWMVEKAEEIENPHPLSSEEDRKKVAATFNHVQKLVMEYNEKWFQGKEYPSLVDPEPQQEEKPQVNLDDWLDDD